MTINLIRSADKITYNKYLYNYGTPVFKGENKNDSAADTIKNMSTKEKAGWGVGIGAFFTSAFLLIKNLKKPSSGSQKDLTKLAKQLIKKLKPQDKELAMEFYPVLIKNSEELQIKPESFDNVIKSIPKENKDFMLSEGFDIIGSKAREIRAISGDSVSDLLNIISALNNKNKKVFVSLSENIERLKIEDAEDFQTLLTDINPQKHDYIFTQLLPKIEPYEKLLGINNPERYAKIFNHINKEIETIIPEIANFKTSNNSKIDKFGIIMELTKDNKDCILPILNNLEKFNYSSYDIKNILKNISNKNVHSIDIAAKNVPNIKELNLKTEDIFKLAENKEQADILDLVLNDYKFFKIESADDIKIYIKNLKTANMDFIKSDLMPKLKDNAGIFGINSPDQIMDILNSVTPKTVSAIDLVSKYASTLGANISYSSLLAGITEANISKLPKFMENIKNTEVWDNFMVSAKDFEKLIDSI